VHTQDQQVVVRSREPRLGPIELGLLRRQLGLHRGLAVAQHRDLALELVDAAAEALDLGGQDALVLLGAVDLRLRRVELVLQARPGGRRDQQQAEQRQRQRAADRACGVSGRSVSHRSGQGRARTSSRNRFGGRPPRENPLRECQSRDPCARRDRVLQPTFLAARFA
jgi:hypothetical protein